MTTELEVDTIELPLSVVEQIADLIKENDFLDNGDDSDDDDSSLDEFINGGSAQTACLSSSVNYIIPEGSQQDISVGIVPKGNGALLSDYRGNCRGINAVDLQMSREQNDQVASGDYSAIVGGASNKVTGDYSAIVGGRNNTVTKEYSSIIGGQENNVSTVSSIILGGYQNSVLSWLGVGVNSSIIGGINNIIEEGNNASIIGGNQSTISADECSVIGGWGNTVSSRYSSVIGGTHNTVSSLYSTVIGGYQNTVSRVCAGTIGGRYLHANTENMVTIGQYNETTTTNRPDPSLDGNINRLTRSVGGSVIATNITNADQGTVAFSIGNGTATDNRRDVFLVTNEGTTWTRRAYTCSFGADYAEIFPVSQESQLPTAGDLVSIDDSGSVHVYSEQYSNVVGIVTTNPSVVAEGRSILKHQRDPDTLELILDESGEPKIRDEYTDNTLNEVTVGLVGRILLKNKWIVHIPSRWTVLKNAPESKVYDGYTYVLVR